MSQIDYKSKYQSLKQRFMESVDVAFRLGYEQGSQAAQMQNMQQQQQQMADQQAQQAQMAANGMGGQDDGSAEQPGQEGAQIQDDSRGVGQQTGAAGAPQGMGGSELDNHINELQGLMNKSEYGSEQWETLNKSLNGLKNIKFALDFQKNQELIKSISVNLKKAPVFAGRAKHNLNDQGKQALTLQHKIVNDIMKNWENEANGLSNDIAKILQTEGLSKKE